MNHIFLILDAFEVYNNADYNSLFDEQHNIEKLKEYLESDTEYVTQWFESRSLKAITEEY